MGPIQKELYNLLKSETARILKKMDKESKEYFRAIGKNSIKLLEAATNPMLLSTNNDIDRGLLSGENESVFFKLIYEYSKFEVCSKIEYLKNRVNEILNKNDKNKIVIWSYFVRNITYLERIFNEYLPVTIFGDIMTGNEDDENTREGKIRKFHNESSCRIMIANPQAGGEGISLHKVCHFAIYLDRNFNAAYFLQSLDRIHRLGLDPKINTYIEILISKNTIDEVLIDRLNNKIKNLGVALNDPNLQALAYEPEDILEIDKEGLDRVDVDSIEKHIFQSAK